MSVAIRLCSVDGCGRKHRSNGYCNTHYWRATKGLPMETPIEPRAPQKPRVRPAMDRELESLRFCVETLVALDEQARGRVIQYLLRRWPEATP